MLALETLQLKNLSIKLPDYLSARKEVWKTFNQKTRWVLAIDNAPPDPSNIVWQITLTFENSQMPKKTTNMKRIAQRCFDSKNLFITQDIIALRLASTRLLMSVAAVQKLQLFIQNVNIVCLQYSEPLFAKACNRLDLESRRVSGVMENKVSKLEWNFLFFLLFWWLLKCIDRTTSHTRIANELSHTGSLLFTQKSIKSLQDAAKTTFTCRRWWFSKQFV